MKLVNASQAARVAACDELPGKVNYFIGNDPKKWRTGVPKYSKVKYEGVFPGIDLIYYGRDGRLEFDFVVGPEANPRAILLHLEVGNSTLETRNSKLVIERGGDLVIAAEGGEVRLHKPLIYQPQGSRAGLGNSDSRIRNSELVDGRYVLAADNHIGFEIPAYDRTRPLIIDPVLSYSTYLGGSGSDYAYALAVDAAGSAYVTGYTNSPDFPLGSVANVTPGGGTCGVGLDIYPCYEAFVAKLNPAGTALVYTTYLGGSGDDVGTGIAVDPFGNAYIAGYTNSNNLFTAGAAQPTLGGGTCGVSPTTYPCYDGFVAKLDSQGSLLYCAYLGGTNDDIAQSIAVDSVGNALVAGFATSVDFPVTPDALQVRFSGGTSDAFVTKLNPNGSAFLYSTYLGGSGEDYATRVRVESSGAAYIAGYTNSGDFPSLGAFQSAPGEGTCGSPSSPSACFDAFVTKLNAQGAALVYSTFLGGSGGDYAYGLAIDDAGNAYVTGLTTSTGFPVSAAALQTTGGGRSVDAFVTKLDASGSHALYSTYLGSLGVEAGLDIALDSAGNAYVAGYAYGSGFPLVNPLQPANGGFYDAFVAELNTAGTSLIFSTYLGGSGNEKAHSVALDPDGNVYIAGGTFSTDFPLTAGAMQPLFGGGAFDAFVAKLGNPGHPLLSLSDTTLSFADQGISTTSPAVAVTLTNAGDVPLAVASLDVTGEFSQSNDCGSTVAPGGTCTLSVTFAPGAPGTRSGSLSILSNAQGSPHRVLLSGAGVVAFTLSPAPSSAIIIKGVDQAEFSLSASSAFGFSGTITLGCSGAAPAICAFEPPAILPGQSSKLTVRSLSALDAETLSFTATGASGVQIASAALILKIADFTLTTEPTQATVSAGDAATYIVTLTPLNGFAQSVDVQCSGQPQTTTCSLSPRSQTLNGAGAAAVALTLQTTARSSAPSRTPTAYLPTPVNFHLWAWLWLMVSVWYCARTTRRQPGAISAPLAALLVCALLWTACGGGSVTIAPPPSPSGTSAGTYTITVTGCLSSATGGNLAPLSHQTTVKLTVN